MAITRIMVKSSKARPRKASSRLEQLQQMPDEDLMQYFQAGTEAAFDILVARYSERLMHYLYGFLGDKKRCEDLLQDTYVRVHRNRHAYVRIAKFSTWLYTIAGNLARSEYRKQKRHRTYSIHSVSRDNEDYEMVIPDETFSPDKFTEHALQDERIQEAIRQLAPHFREVITLRDLQQLSYKEIATITGLPMGTVKSRINRGRRQLRGLLSDIYPFWGD